MKDKALLYLDRHVKKLEAIVEVDHKLMANQGFSYEERQRVENKAAGAKGEYDAMMWIRALVMSQEE